MPCLDGMHVKAGRLWGCKGSTFVVSKLLKPEEGPLLQRWWVTLEPQREERRQEYYVSAWKGDCMQVPVEPIFTVIMGILILLVPRLLNYFVAIYLIIIGILGLLNKVHL